MSHIFISHSRDDRPIALQFESALSGFGFSVWIDTKIRSGKIWDKEIERQLREAGCVLVLWSQKSIDSNFVRAEAKRALEHHKLISVRIEAGVELPLEFTYIQTIDCSGSGNLQAVPEFRAVLQDVQALLKEENLFVDGVSRSSLKAKPVLESPSKKTIAPEITYSVPADLAHRLREKIQQEIASAVEVLPLPKLCQSIEDLILDYLRVTLFEELTRLVASSGIQCRQLDNSRIACCGSRFELRVDPLSATDPSIIVIALKAIALDAKQARTTLLKADIHGSGQFREMRLVVDSRLERWQSVLGEVATCTLEAGARWLEQHVRSELDRLTGNAASALYRIVREILPETLAREVWLFALTKEKGIYLSDPIQREIARDRVLARPIAYEASPTVQLAELTTRVLNATDVFAGEIIGQGGTLEVDLYHAKYAEYNSGFEIAEESVYHTPRLAGQALVKEGDARLIAGYPAHFRPSIEVVLARERRRFRDTLAESARSLKRLMRDLDLSVASSGMIKQLASRSSSLGRGRQRSSMG